MRIKCIVAGILFVLIASVAYSQAAHVGEGSSTPDAAPIVGVWRADMDGLPSIALLITNENGTLSGAALFYFHHRDEGQPWTSTPGLPEPLFNPKFDGTTLTFQVCHRRAHPPRTLNDPPVSFRFKLIGANRGELVNENEASPVTVLVRSEY